MSQQHIQIVTSGYLMELEKSGFLISEKVGKEKLYLNHKLMAILEIP